MKKQNYSFEYFESPDIRGIDVALLYKKSDFKVIRSHGIPINIPDEIEKDYTTRNILYVKGEYKKNHVLHIFVNHWPSRRGGLEASEPKRVYVARQLRSRVDSLLRINDQTNILIMGDFNDEPDNKSVAKILNAKPSYNEKDVAGLVNLASPLDEQKEGSYNFRGNWNMLDQIIVSSSLANPNNSFTVTPQQVFKADWMMFTDKKYGSRPNRTYGGPNYYGGYSDHLPVFIELKMKK